MKLWDLYARVYDALPRFCFAYQRLVEDVLSTVERAVPARGRILDAGCGTGNFSVELARRGYSVEGIDFSAGMLSRAKRKAGKAGLANAAFRHWNIDDGLTCYGDGTFDAVLSVHALYTLTEPDKVIGEYYRVLRPGGRLILAEPQHPIKVIPVAKEIYRDGGLSNIGKLTATQLGVGIFNLLIGKRLRDGSYHYWNQEELRRELESQLLRICSMVPAYSAGSDLLAVAVKPRVHFEANDRRFITVAAETSEDMEKVWRLRHQVYCEELGYEPQAENGLESDVYDEYAIHLLTLDKENRAVGTLRAVPENIRGFPMDSDFPLAEYVRERGISGALEIGRFAIHKVVDAEHRGEVAFGLFSCLSEYCSVIGTRDIFSTTQPKVMQKYKMPGVTQIGEPFEYSRPLTGGLWVPIHCDIQEAYNYYLKGSPG